MGLLEVLRMRGNPRRRYNELAGLYRRRGDAVEHPEVPILLDRLAVEPGETVLDVGCGLGYALEVLAERVGPGGHAIGVDVSDRMIEFATERIDGAGFGDRTTLHRLDARDLAPIGDGSVDAATLTFTLEVLPPEHRPAVLAECRRVLDAEGRLGVLAIASEDSLAVSLYERANRIVPGLVDSRPIDAAAVLTANGFSVETVERHRVGRLPVDLVVARSTD